PPAVRGPIATQLPRGFDEGQPILPLIELTTNCARAALLRLSRRRLWPPQIVRGVATARTHVPRAALRIRLSTAGLLRRSGPIAAPVAGCAEPIPQRSSARLRIWRQSRPACGESRPSLPWIWPKLWPDRAERPRPFARPS